MGPVASQRARTRSARRRLGHRHTVRGDNRKGLCRADRRISSRTVRRPACRWRRSHRFFAVRRSSRCLPRFHLVLVLSLRMCDSIGRRLRNDRCRWHWIPARHLVSRVAAPRNVDVNLRDHRLGCRGGVVVCGASLQCRGARNAPISDSGKRGAYCFVVVPRSASVEPLVATDPQARWSPVSRLDPAKAIGPGFAGSAVGGKESLQMSFLAIVIGTLLALPLAYAGARSGRSVARHAAARLVALAIRSIPPTVWALLVLLVILPGVLPGALALGIYTAGVLARLFGDVLESSTTGARTLLHSAGAKPLAVALYSTIPEVVPAWTSLALYRWEVAAREVVGRWRCRGRRAGTVAERAGKCLCICDYDDNYWIDHHADFPRRSHQPAGASIAAMTQEP